MAYMDQKRKKELSEGINEVLKKYKMKGTLSVENYSTLVCNIRSGIIDFEKLLTKEAIDKGHYHNGYMLVDEGTINEDFNGIAAEFLLELKKAMMKGNHNNSDYMTDYYDVGWYIKIYIGDYNKPYIVTN